MPNFNIPTDVYSWSGLPQQHRESLLSAVMPQLNQAVTNYPNIMPGYVEPQMRKFKDVAKGAGQGLLDQLATRNVLGSQGAADATTGLMKGLNEQRFGKLADLDLQSKMAQPGMLGQIAGLGQASEQPFQPYQAMLNFLMSQG